MLVILSARRVRRGFVLVAGVLAWFAPGVARAQCGLVQTDVFDMADHSAAIAVVEAADGGVRVLTPVAGDMTVFARLPADPSSTPPPPSAVPPRPPRGGRHRHRPRVIELYGIDECGPTTSIVSEIGPPTLVFADAHGAPANPWGRSSRSVGTDWGIRPLDVPAWARALAPWLATRDSTARMRILVPLFARADLLGGSAVLRVLSDPALYGRLDAVGRAALLRGAAAFVAAHPSEGIVRPMSEALWHLHDVAAIGIVVDGFAATATVDDGESLNGVLERLTNHVPTPADGQSADAWRRFAAAHAGMDPTALVAAGWRERGITPPLPADRHALASLLRSRQAGLDATVAADLCARAALHVVGDPSSTIDAAAAALAGPRPAAPPPTTEQLAATCEAP